MSELQHPIELNTLTPEEAIQATIDMWSDMRETLGVIPSPYDRVRFKRQWLLNHKYKEHLFDEVVLCDCFLCHCAGGGSSAMRMCEKCPIKWPEQDWDCNQDRVSCVCHRVDYQIALLPDILDYLKDENNWRWR